MVYIQGVLGPTADGAVNSEVGNSCEEADAQVTPHLSAVHLGWTQCVVLDKSLPPAGLILLS